MTPPPQGRFRPLVGMLRLARGRPDGLACFGDTPEAFLGSLAPLLAVPVVFALLLLARAGLMPAVATLLITTVVQLSPLLLSHALARAWGREALWLRYAIAFNWCQWALPLAAVALLLVLPIGLSFGLAPERAGELLLLGVTGYALWLNWLLARHGLNLPGWWAAALVGVATFGTSLLVAAPQQLAKALG